MGRDKAGLAMAGGTFAGNIRTAMGDFEEKFFSHDSDFYGNQMTLEGFETLTDEKELKGKGPAAGIVTTLKVCRSRWLMVVPCDSPMMGPHGGNKAVERPETAGYHHDCKGQQRYRTSGRHISQKGRASDEADAACGDIQDEGHIRTDRI